jgi:hypothetical protein
METVRFYGTLASTYESTLRQNPEEHQHQHTLTFLRRLQSSATLMWIRYYGNACAVQAVYGTVYYFMSLKSFRYAKVQRTRVKLCVFR